MTFEDVLGLVNVLIGLGAFVLVAMVKARFPQGSELKRITESLIPVIIFLMCFSIWHVIREVFHWKETYGEFVEYPEYLFISLAFILLFRASRTLFTIARKVGIIDE
jgi:chromate transport protein ChrA